MATIKGRNGYLYWNAAAVSEEISYSLKAEREFIEDTAFGDTNRTYQTGFMDFELTVGRHYDQAGFFGLESDAIANDPTPRAFYHYPNRNVTTDYWYGASAYVSLNSQGGGLGDIVDEEYVIKAAAPIYHRTA